jgi:hypothetical protein
MLTADMKHLRGEIDALHGSRAKMVDDLRQGVGELMAQFGHARAKMAERTKHERVAFVNHLKRSVATQRRHMRHDLAGAQKAWAGKS